MGLLSWITRVDPKYNYKYLVRSKWKETCLQTEEKAAMGWKQREAEAERRCYTIGSQYGGRNHEPRNLALDVKKSLETDFYLDPPEVAQLY